MTETAPEDRTVGIGARTILVGVDASEESREALRWALHYASLVAARVEVVHAWSTKQEFVWVPEGPWETPPIDAARKGLAKMVDDVVGPDPTVTVSKSVIEGHAARVLIDGSDHADLLVVGSRGRGGWDGLTLGSVSGSCAEHAHCSVMIVRPSIQS